MSLSVSGLVRVTINLSPLAAAARSFGVLCVAGDSDVISGKERLRSYLGIDGVASDFGLDAPETQAAELYFGQSPKPRELMIGRWLREATSAQNIGGILTSAEQTLSLWTGISDGSFSITIDGGDFNVMDLDFTSGVFNLNGVASVITAGLVGAGAAATCTWDGSKFTITSVATGAGVKSSGTITLDTNPSYGVQASGTITLSGLPSNGDTVTIKGTVVTFVSGTPSGNQVQIAGTAALTSAALQTFLANSADSNLAANTYNTIAAITTITARVYGTAGNSYGLLKSGSNIAVSAATLLGGVAADTLTVDGTAFTFVPVLTTGNQILVGATVTATAANVQATLAASSAGSVDEATYSRSGTVVTVEYGEVGTHGDSFTLAKSSSHITLSGATLSGGAEGSAVSYAEVGGGGTDVAVMLKLTEETDQTLVPGYDAETPAECAAALANKSAAWYGLMFAASVAPTDDENLDVSAFIEALDLTRVFGVTITNTNVLSSLVENDLASLMKAAAYRQSFCQYSENEFAVASFFGRAFSVNFLGNKTTITLMYKQEPGVVPQDLTENQAAVLKAKRCNVFVSYNNDTAIIQYGVMSGPAYFDEIHGLDWLQNAIQTNCYNVLYLSATKIPQTDQGVNQLVNAIAEACGQGVANQLVAPGVWNADGFGELKTGDFLKTGFYIYATPVALQSQAERDTRAAPPIKVAIKLAGAIQSLDVEVQVNR